ncbi:unnamed protein product, partial [marine sediment metagenome]
AYRNNRLISRVPEGIKGVGLLDKNLKGGEVNKRS